MKRYSYRTSLLTLLLCGSLALFNGWINPFLVFNTTPVPGINTFITENYYKQLVFKPYQLRAIKPRSIIIGASHAGIAFDPAPLPQPAYNLAVGGASSYINYRLLQEAVTDSPALDTAILETPFFSFNADDPNNKPQQDPGFEQRLSLDAHGNTNRLLWLHALGDRTASLLSWEVTRASIRTLIKQEKVASKKKSSFIQDRHGQWLQQAPANATTYALFEGSWKKFLYDEWFPAPSHRFTLSPDTHSGPLGFYRDSLKLLYAKDIHTTVVIAPLHGSLLIALREAGLWHDFDQWKKLLAAINEEEAQHAGKNPFVIVDYAFINSYTTETLPTTENPYQRLQWFNDSAHASPAFGAVILDEIISGNIQIGKILSGKNSDGYFLKTEEDLTRYADTHPGFVTTIKNLITQTPWRPSLQHQAGTPL